MLQQDVPDDYVIATGQTWSIQDFVVKAFKAVGIENWRKHVEANNPKFMRPAEVDYLIGDSSKAKKVLGWQPKTSFDQLVVMMVKNDLDAEMKTDH